MNDLLEHSLIRMQGRHSPEAEQILRALHAGHSIPEPEIAAAPSIKEDSLAAHMPPSMFMVRRLAWHDFPNVLQHELGSPHEHFG